MGKKSCTYHPHTKVGPHEQKLATLTIVHLSRPQMGSESLCRGEVRPSPRTSSLPGRSSLRVWWCCTRRGHTSLPGAIARRGHAACAAGGPGPICLSPYGVRSVLRGAVRTPAVSDSWCPGPPTPRMHASRRPKPGGPLAPGTVGVCGSMAAGHTRHSDSGREPPRGSRRPSALSAGSGPFTRGPYAAACHRP